MKTKKRTNCVAKFDGCSLPSSHRSGWVFLSSCLTPSESFWELLTRAHAPSQPSRLEEPEAGRRRGGSTAPPRFSEV